MHRIIIKKQNIKLIEPKIKNSSHEIKNQAIKLKIELKELSEPIPKKIV